MKEACSLFCSQALRSASWLNNNNNYIVMLWILIVRIEYNIFEHLLCACATCAAGHLPAVWSCSYLHNTERKWRLGEEAMDLRPHCWQGTKLGAKGKSTLIQSLVANTGSKAKPRGKSKYFWAPTAMLQSFGKGNSQGPCPCGVYSLSEVVQIIKKEKTAWICIYIWYMLQGNKQNAQWQM